MPGSVTTVEPPEGSCVGRPPFPLFILARGFVDDARRVASATGASPRVDVFELERISGRRILDSQWLVERQRSEWTTRVVCRAVGPRWGMAWRALRESDQACLYSPDEILGIPLGIILRLTRRPSVFVATRLENPDVGRTRWRRLVFRSALRFALGRLDLVLCRSRRHMTHLQDRYGFTKTVLGQEVADTDFFDPDRPHPPGGGAMPPEVPAGPFILSGGLELRDYETLLEAVRGVPVEVIIAADSPWSQFRFDHDAELPPNVRVSRFSRSQMRELYARARMVVVPVLPTTRTCGVSVVLEAFAMRKPVVVTRTGGLDDYVTDGENVLEVQPRDPRDLREKIDRVLSDDDLARGLAARGHELVRRRFRLDEYPRIVVEALGSRAGARLGSALPTPPGRG
jgi:glycosyltransferase involved in cell wall biosynthesis